MADEIHLSDGTTALGGHALRSSVPVRGETDTLGVFQDPHKPTIVHSTSADLGALAVPGVKNIAEAPKRQAEPPAVPAPKTRKQLKAERSERSRKMWEKRRAKLAQQAPQLPASAVDEAALAAHASAQSASQPMPRAGVSLPSLASVEHSKRDRDSFSQVTIILPDMRDATMSEVEAAILESRKLTDVYAQTAQNLSMASRDLQCEYCRRVVSESQGDRPYSTFCPIDPNGRAGKRMIWCSQTCDVQWKMQNPTWRPQYMQTNLGVR